MFFHFQGNYLTTNVLLQQVHRKKKEKFYGTQKKMESTTGCKEIILQAERVAPHDQLSISVY